MKIQIGSVIRHSSFVILLCTGYCVLCTPSARGQPNGLFPETIIAGPGLSSTASGRTLTLSVTAAGGTTFTPGLNLSLAGGTLNVGTATLGSMAYGSTSSASFSGTVTITGSETLTSALTVATSSSVGTLTVNGLMASADYAATVSGGTCTVNFANGNVQHATLTTSVTLINFTGTPIAGTRYTLVFIQPSSGTDQPTTWTASPAIKWGGGNAPVLTQTSNKADIVSLLYANGNLYGVTSNNF